MEHRIKPNDSYDYENINLNSENSRLSSNFTRATKLYIQKIIGREITLKLEYFRIKKPTESLITIHIFNRFNAFDRQLVVSDYLVRKGRISVWLYVNRQ